MDKTKGKRHEHPSKSLRDEVAQVTKGYPDAPPDDRVWIRDDGAVCFGDECVVLKPNSDGSLLFQVDPSACGEVAGPVILEHLIKTAGHGITVIVPRQDEEAKKSK
jgi:hypothetical protein